MVQFPRPVRMQVMKVTAHKKHERALLNTLIDTNSVEFIDVELKESYGRIQSTPEEQEVVSLVRKIAGVIEFLEIDAPVKFSPDEIVQLDDRELAPILSYCQDVLKDIEPLTHKMNDEIAELESQLETSRNKNRLAELLVVMPEMFFEDVGEGSYFYITAGIAKFQDTERLKWQLKEATDEQYLFFEKYAGEGDSVVVVAVPNEQRRKVDQILSSYGFSSLSIPSDIKGRAPEIIEQTSQQIELYEGKLAGLSAEKEQLAQTNQKNLLAASEALQIEEAKIDAKKYFRETGTSMALWGWVSEPDIESVTKSLHKSTNNEAMIQVADPDLPEVAYPTRLENRTLVKPLEELTKSFGAPGYHELDPSWIMAIAFPIMFGIMFADIGHGFILSLMGLAGIIANKRSGIPPVQGGMMDELKTYFKKGGWLLFFSGLSAIFFGFIFGSFFGIEDFTIGSYHFKPIWFNSAWEINSDHLLHAPGGPYIGIDGTILLLELSLVIGMINITFGLILKAYQIIKDGKLVEAICFPAMLIVFYFTGFILVFTYNLNPLDWMQMTDPTPLTFGLFPNFTPMIPSALLVFLGGFITPVLIMLVYMMKGHGIEGMSEVFDYAISLISHTLSYSRILAVNKVHAILSALFLVTLPTIINISAIQHPHTALGVATGIGVVNIVFQIFIIMTLEALISFLQALRLNWVEFFSKFFEGRGHIFKPFSYVRRFTRSRS